MVTMFTFTIISALLCIATGFNILASVISWRRAKTSFGFYFAVSITSITLWTLTSAFDYAAVPIPLKVFFAKWEYLFYHVGEAFLLLFFLTYGGYVELAKSKILRVVLWTGCSINILLAWTNDWHGWLWSGFSPGEFGNNTVIFEHGPAYLWMNVTGYLLYGSIVLTAWLVSRRGSTYARRQGQLLFYAVLFPLLGNLAYQFQPPELKGIDWVSVLISATSILCVWALYGTKLLDLTPIAREKLIDSFSDGMVVLDTQGRIVDINKPAAQMLGSLPDKLVGKSLEEFPAFAQSILVYLPEKEIRTEIETGVAEKSYFDVLITPLFENQTQVVGRLIIFRDMTSRKQNELRLLQFSRAVEQSPTSIVITDLDGRITYVNPQFSFLTGYTLEETIGQNPKILQSGLTPPDTYREMWQTITSGQIWKGEFLNKKKNGDLYWEHATIAPVLDHDGRVINFIAVKVDVTERRRAEEELQMSEEKFAKAFRLCAEVITITSVKEGLIVEINDSVKKVLGYTRDEVKGKSTNALNVWIEPAQREQYVASLLRDGFVHDWEVQLRTKTGQLVDILLSGEIIELQGNKHILGTLRNITAYKRMESELERLATTDPLTGVYNRRQLTRLAEVEFERAHRYGHAISVVMMDVDYFKKINDTYGHTAGDSVLVSLTQRLTREVRAIDLVARYGGEEFMVILPETTLEKAMVIAERIRLSVADNSVVVDDQTIRFTISLGVASNENTGQDFESLLKEADRSLYQAKQSGRNRVVSSPHN